MDNGPVQLGLNIGGVTSSSDGSTGLHIEGLRPEPVDVPETAAKLHERLAHGLEKAEVEPDVSEILRATVFSGGPSEVEAAFKALLDLRKTDS